MTSDLPIRLRKALRGDVDAMHAMVLELARETRDADRVRSCPLDLLHHGFGPDPLFEGILAERGDYAVGLCLYYFTYSTWLGEPGVYVSDVYVDESVRGTGLGRQLLAAAAERGIERSATHLRLTVNASNTAARAFYARIGMEHRDTEDTWHLGGEAFAHLAEAAR